MSVGPSFGISYMVLSSSLTGTFGIGTSLTNDFKKLSSGGTQKSRSLNMVIKLAAVNGKHCVKISDEPTKVLTLLYASGST